MKTTLTQVAGFKTMVSIFRVIIVKDRLVLLVPFVLSTGFEGKGK